MAILSTPVLMLLQPVGLTRLTSNGKVNTQGPVNHVRHQGTPISIMCRDLIHARHSAILDPGMGSATETQDAGLVVIARADIASQQHAQRQQTPNVHLARQGTTARTHLLRPYVRRGHTTAQPVYPRP